MTRTMEATEFYRSRFAQFESAVAGTEPAGVRRIRRAAIARFAELGFPTTDNEEWRHTDVTPIATIPFRDADYSPVAPAAEKLARVTFDAAGYSQLVFLNGRFSPDLSALRPLPVGVTAGSLAAALGTDPSGVEPYLARYARYEDRAFVALNTAFLKDGAFVYVPSNTVVDEPLHLLYASTAEGEATVSHPRNLIVMGPGSRASIVESYVGLDDGLYFTNAVTELVLGENAVLEHCTLQRESTEAFHVATLAVHQEGGSRFSSHSIALGGAIARNEITAALEGEGIECTLNGLYAETGRQHVDTRTRIDHAKPRCASRQFYKGILGGRATGVFNGKILVRQDAQKTDARQTTKNLLLSEDAVIHTKPQLEIFADDVKCMHGATVGSLDEEAIFYLRSRGIGKEAARRLMTHVFAGEIINQIGIIPIRTQLAALLSAWVSQDERAWETFRT